MTSLVTSLILSLLLVVPASSQQPPIPTPGNRCYVSTARDGSPLLVCPCRTSYQCEEAWPIRRWRGRYVR